MGIDLSPLWSLPENPRDPAHAAKANRAVEYSFGLFADPILKDGDFGAEVKAVEEAEPGSGLTEWEKDIVKGK